MKQTDCLRRYAVLCLVLASTACLAERPVELLIPEGAARPSRPSDGLLQRPDLQEVVELQIDRNGAELIRHLRSSEAAVRARAAFALASVQDARARDPLLAALSDSVPSVRRDAAFALGQLGDASVGPTLFGALGEESDGAVRHRLIEALGKVGDATALGRLDPASFSDAEAPEVALTVARFGVRDVHDADVTEWLANSLTAADPVLRLNAAYYFNRVPDYKPWRHVSHLVRRAMASYPLDEPAAMHLALGIEKLGVQDDHPQIMRFLRGGTDWRTRTNAAQALSGWENQFAQRAALMAALDDPSDHVSERAGMALANSPAPPMYATEIVAWAETNPERWHTVTALLTTLVIGSESDYVFHFIERWRDTNVDAWVAGVGAMEELGGRAVVDNLVAAAESSARTASVAGLRALLDRWEDDQTRAATQDFYWSTFSSAARSGVGYRIRLVAPALADSVLGPRGGLALLSEIYGTLHLPDDEAVALAIVAALGTSDSPLATAMLKHAAESSHPRIREAAARVGSGQEPGPGRPGAPRGEAPALDWAELAALGEHPHLVLETNRGRVVILLATEEAPQTVQTITRFAREGRYDGIPFHRVVGNFVIQGGDFSRGSGSGGPDFSIRSEFTEVPYRRGTIGMANSGKDTETSQFFITHSMQPHLDGGYTAFGWVTEGMDVVDRITAGDRVLHAQVLPDRR